MYICRRRLHSPEVVPVARCFASSSSRTHSISRGEPNRAAIICMPMPLCFSCSGSSPVTSASLRSNGWLYKALARRRIGSILFVFYGKRKREKEKSSCLLQGRSNGRNFLTIDFRYHFPVFLYRRFNERVEDCAGEIDRPLPRLFFLDKNVFCYREHLQ